MHLSVGPHTAPSRATRPSSSAQPGSPPLACLVAGAVGRGAEVPANGPHGLCALDEGGPANVPAAEQGLADSVHEKHQVRRRPLVHLVAAATRWNHGAFFFPSMRSLVACTGWGLQRTISTRVHGALCSSGRRASPCTCITRCGHLYPGTRGPVLQWPPCLTVFMHHPL